MNIQRYVKMEGMDMLESITFDLNELNTVTIIFRTVMAILIGGIIGTERDIKLRAAGMRTHMLVCLGAAIVMMTNEYIYTVYDNPNIDITRMGAQVVSGIGFIGAGTILVTSDNRIKGLTTAAGLWAAAAIGLAIGIGFYEIAVVGGITIIGVVTLMQPFKNFVLNRTTQRDLTLMIHSRDGFTSFLQYTVQAEIKVSNIQLENENQRDNKQSELIFIVDMELGEQLDKDEVIRHLESAEGIVHVLEVQE